MSALEVEARPILLPIVRGIETNLEPLAQITIGRWATKTAMVFEAIRVDDDWFYSQDERNQLFTTGRPPARTNVWLSRYVGLNDTYAHAVNLGGVIEGVRMTAYVTTVVFRYLVLQVSSGRFPDHIQRHVTINIDQTDGPWDAASLRIFPAERVAIRWPPAVTLTDDGDTALDRFSDRWGPVGA